jgi:hypothetical protein
MSGSDKCAYVNQGAPDPHPDSTSAPAAAPVSPYLLRLLEDAYAWIGRTLPTDVWGKVDRHEEEEREALLKRFRAVLDP